jgi:phthiocerol/phenolphthiocerol synthesis type-I polyketide synthase D
VRGDIADPEAAERVVHAAEATNLQLRGVLHLAAVIDDSLLLTMSPESLERVWAPKVTGALRLHEATAGHALDWWLGFSSVSSLLGSAGQAAYGSANAWLDAFVSWRNAAGLPAAAINWGPWSHVGAARSLTHAAVDSIDLAEGVEALECLLASGRVHTGMARLRTDRALAAFPEIGGLGYFAEVVGEMRAAGEDNSWPGPDGLRDLDPVDVERIITERLCSRAAAIMGHSDNSAFDLSLPLVEIGMDSLMAVRIRNAARADFGAEPPVSLLLQGASMHDVAADLVRQLGLAGPVTNERGSDPGGLRDRANQRAAARRNAPVRQKRGQRL